MLRSESGVDGEVGHTDKLFNKDIGDNVGHC